MRLTIIQTVLGILFLGGVHAAPNQNDEYYRYFQVEIEDLEKFQRSDFSDLVSSRQSFQVLEICEGRGLVMIAVNADYPKRVDDIVEEIDELFSTLVPNRKLKKVEMISIDEKLSFCR